MFDTTTSVGELPSVTRLKTKKTNPGVSREMIRRRSEGGLGARKVFLGEGAKWGGGRREGRAGQISESSLNQHTMYRQTPIREICVR